jgi:uncharacterized tellurite resistance protein B-like protein
MYLTRNEKLSIVFALEAALSADGVTKRAEVEFLNTVLSNFNFQQSDLTEAKNMDDAFAIKTIKEMNQENKNFLKGALANMVLIDDDLHSEEQRLLSALFSILD